MFPSHHGRVDKKDDGNKLSSALVHDLYPEMLDSAESPAIDWMSAAGLGFTFPSVRSPTSDPADEWMRDVTPVHAPARVPGVLKPSQVGNFLPTTSKEGIDDDDNVDNSALLSPAPTEAGVSLLRNDVQITLAAPLATGRAVAPHRVRDFSPACDFEQLALHDVVAGLRRVTALGMLDGKPREVDILESVLLWLGELGWLYLFIVETAALKRGEAKFRRRIQMRVLRAVTSILKGREKVILDALPPVTKGVVWPMKLVVNGGVERSVLADEVGRRLAQAVDAVEHSAGPVVPDEPPRPSRRRVAPPRSPAHSTVPSMTTSSTRTTTDASGTSGKCADLIVRERLDVNDGHGLSLVLLQDVDSDRPRSLVAPDMSPSEPDWWMLLSDGDRRSCGDTGVAYAEAWIRKQL